MTRAVQKCNNKLFLLLRGGSFLMHQLNLLELNLFVFLLTTKHQHDEEVTSDKDEDPQQQERPSVEMIIQYKKQTLMTRYFAVPVPPKKSGGWSAQESSCCLPSRAPRRSTPCSCEEAASESGLEHCLQLACTV
jgi:hypothetical protein